MKPYRTLSLLKEHISGQKKLAGTKPEDETSYYEDWEVESTRFIIIGGKYYAVLLLTQEWSNLNAFTERILQLFYGPGTSTSVPLSGLSWKKYIKVKWNTPCFISWIAPRHIFLHRLIFFNVNVIFFFYKIKMLNKVSCSISKFFVSFCGGDEETKLALGLHVMSPKT